MEDKSSKIGIIAVIFALIAISASGQLTTSEFYLNLMNGSVTLLAGNNVTLSEDAINKTITISSSGGTGISGNSFDDIYVNSINTNTTDIIEINADHIIFSNQSYGFGTQLQSPDGDVTMGLIDDGTHSRITMTSQDATYESVVTYASGYFDASIWDNINGYGTEYTYYTDRLISAVWGLTNYTHTTQRDGSFDIKFNGNERYNFTDSQLNMNGAAITNNPQITALQAEKVNKTGDNMTGLLRSKQILSYNVNSDTNLPSPFDANAIITGINEVGASSLNLITYYNGTYYASAMNGYKANGNISNPLPILKDDYLFSVGVRGYDGTSFSSTRAYFSLQSTENWTPTAMGTRFDVYTTGTGGTSRTNVFSIDGEKNATIPKLSGTGNAFVCVNSVGTLYRSATACV